MLTSNSPKAVEVNYEDVELFTPMLHKVPHVGNPIEGYFNDDREVSVSERMRKRGRCFTACATRGKPNQQAIL